MKKKSPGVRLASFMLYVKAAPAKSPQLCPTLCDPIDCSPPGSPSLRFSRQEHWSGLPFPSPMHESEKFRQTQPYSTSIDYQVEDLLIVKAKWA